MLSENVQKTMQASLSAKTINIACSIPHCGPARKSPMSRSNHYPPLWHHSLPGSHTSRRYLHVFRAGARHLWTSAKLTNQVPVTPAFATQRGSKTRRVTIQKDLDVVAERHFFSSNAAMLPIAHLWIMTEIQVIPDRFGQAAFLLAIQTCPLGGPQH